MTGVEISVSFEAIRSSSSVRPALGNTLKISQDAGEKRPPLVKCPAGNFSVRNDPDLKIPL